MRSKKCKYSIKVISLLFFLFIFFYSSGQNAKRELEEVFNDHKVPLDELIITLAKYVEIESKYIIENEDLIINILDNTTLYEHKVDVYNILTNAFWYRNKREKYSYYSNKVDSILRIHKNYDLGIANHLRLSGLYNNDYNQTNFTKSISLLDSAVAVSIKTENIYLIAKSYYSLGYVYWDNSKYPDAMLYFKKSEELFDKTDAKYAIARIYTYYAIHQKNIGNLASSLDYYLKIEKIYQKLNEERRRAEVLGRIGMIYYEMGNYEDAMKMLNSSLSIFKLLNVESRLPYAYEKIGSVFLKMGNYPNAKEYFLNSIELESKSGNKVRLNGLKMNMIDIYIHEKKFNKALEILDESLEIYTKLSFTSGISRIYARYAEIFYLQEKYPEAIENIKRTIELAHELNNITILKDSYKQLSKFYEETGKDKLALKNYQLFKNYSDSLLNEETLLKVENLKTTYEIDKKEQEIQQLEAHAEIKNQQFQLTILIAAIVMMSILTFFSFKRSIDRSKHLKILAEKNKELKEISKKLEISNNFKGRLISNISHEIRTPLNVIVGFTGTLDENTDPKDFKPTIAQIHKSSDNLTQMIDSMLEISLLESDKIKLKKEEFESCELEAIAEDIVKKEFWKKDKSLDYTIDCSKKFKIFSDKNRIKQILHHLIENSVKFTETGEINIMITKSFNNLSIQIKDSGIGIDKDKMNQIFDRFYKIENDKKLYRGAGLGLSISFEVIKLFGGKINVSSEKNKGTCFNIILPLN